MARLFRRSRPPSLTDRPPSRRFVALALLVALLGFVARTGPVAVALEPTATAPSAPAVVEDPATADAPSPADTPSPTGQPLPDRKQRIADTAIWVGLMALLGGGVIAANVNRRPRSIGTDAADTGSSPTS